MKSRSPCSASRTYSRPTPYSSGYDSTARTSQFSRIPNTAVGASAGKQAASDGNRGDYRTPPPRPAAAPVQAGPAPARERAHRRPRSAPAPRRGCAPCGRRGDARARRVRVAAGPASHRRATGAVGCASGRGSAGRAARGPGGG